MASRSICMRGPESLPDSRLSRFIRRGGRNRRASKGETLTCFTTSHLAWRDIAPVKTGPSRFRSPVLVVSTSSTESDIGN